MGVLGLSRWASEMQRLISSEITLPLPKGSGEALLDGEPADIKADGDWLVIDAWAWIHYVWYSMNTNVYQGGSMIQFGVLLGAWIETLRRAGFQLVVVFDGPRLHHKLNSTLTRVQQCVRLNQKLMRAGMNLRRDPEFENGRLLPPGITACVQNVLDQHKVECIMGNDEVDYAIAKLANERSGYVLSRDSDFLILCANAPQAKGYVPLGTFEFIAYETEAAVAAAAAAAVPEQDDDGFTAVSSKPRRKAAPTRSTSLPMLMRTPVLPAKTEELREASLRFRLYSSYKMAEQLKLPIALLPVLAGLVGTENRSSEQAELFNVVFHGVSSRLPVIASLLEEQYAAAQAEAAGNAPQRPPIAATHTAAGAEAPTEDDARDPVSRLVARTFDSVLQYGRKRRGAHIPVSWEQRTIIIDSMNEAALSYAPEHGAEAIERFMAETESGALQAFQKAYWDRKLDQSLVSVCLERIFIARVFLEEPTEPAVQRSVLRQMRSFIWSIIFGVWLDAHPEERRKRIDEEKQEDGEIEATEEPTEDAEAEAEKADNGVDTTDPAIAAILEAKLAIASMEEKKDTEEEEAEEEEQVEEEEEAEYDPADDHPVVTEYTRTEYSLRREEIPVLHLGDVLAETAERTGFDLPDSLESLVEEHADAKDNVEEDEENYTLVPSALLRAPLLDEDKRIDLWLYAHHAATDEVRELPRDLWPIAAALRYIIVENQEHLGRMRTRNNWTAAELDAVVYTACVMRRMIKEASPAELELISESYASGSPSNRSITLSTTASFVLETSTLLTQSLLLGDTLAPSHVLFEAPIFHARLAAVEAEKPTPTLWQRFEDPVLQREVMDAVVDGLEQRLGKTKSKNAQSQRKNAPRQRHHLGMLSETML
ncbi:hypothetical protein MCUN1_000997 [Malassezia cuniculi]|uniref:PIN domain-like protein n=1 Tax=Malassezia cuniculi TaxID=948313 RepID=A0AAF0EPG0_9BASI|nr:hypothetical protein MCUN1_000997 [Malassezia cuniculi]